MDNTIYYQLYIAGGTCICVFDLALGFVIIYQKGLRQHKEFLIYAGCAFFDVIVGLSYLSSGAYRLKLAHENALTHMTTKFDCLMTLHNFLFVYATPGSGILVFITAIDRSIGVFLPLRYFAAGKRYVYRLLFLIFAIPLIAIPVAIITSLPYSVERDQQVICNLGQGVTAQVYLGLRIVRIAGSLACVLIFIPIAVRIFANVSRVSSVAYMATSRNRRLVRTTVTIMLVTLNTICLYAVPDMILLFIPSTQVFAFMNMVKGLVDIMIFLVTQKTLRVAILHTMKPRTTHIQVSVTTNHTTM